MYLEGRLERDDDQWNQMLRRAHWHGVDFLDLPVDSVNLTGHCTGQGRILTQAALEDLVAMHDSIECIVSLYICSGKDVLVPVNLAERRMTDIDIGCVIEHGSFDPTALLPFWDID